MPSTVKCRRSPIPAFSGAMAMSGRLLIAIVPQPQDVVVETSVDREMSRLRLQQRNYERVHPRRANPHVSRGSRNFASNLAQAGWGSLEVRTCGRRVGEQPRFALEVVGPLEVLVDAGEAQVGDLVELVEAGQHPLA